MIAVLVGFLFLSLLFMIPSMGSVVISILWRARRANMNRFSGGSLLLILLASFVIACLGTVVFVGTSMGVYPVFGVVIVLGVLAGQILPCSMSK